MKIVHRYIFRLLTRNVALASVALVTLFLVVDLFDRIDNVLGNDASILTISKYFLFKVPVFLNLTLPIATLVATLLTFGLLSKSSEMTALRASGLKLLWIARPLFIISILLSVFSFALSESVVPYCQRRVRELYNIDIRQSHKEGKFNQTDFWWRDENDFYSAGIFDSRDETLFGLVRLKLSPEFKPVLRIDAKQVKWISPEFGWTMYGVQQYAFSEGESVQSSTLPSATLPISEEPKDFYDSKTDPLTMSYSQLRNFIDEQLRNGVSAREFLADLYAKLSFPLVTFICSFVALPFAILPARTGSMAASFTAGIMIGFLYYVIHSLSLALGRAEILSPLWAAWNANLLLGIAGVLLLWGAEEPS